jgi:hypothetical protein
MTIRRPEVGPHGEMLPPRRSGMPTWLMTVLFAGGFVAVGLGIYWLISSKSASNAVALSQPSPNVESPAAKPGAAAHPLQKHIEISGIRLVDDPRKKNVIMVTFLITNHSQMDVPGLAGNVTLWSNTKRSDEDAQGTFAFNTDVKAFGSKELTVPLTTTKKAVELADWQYLVPDVQITAPPFAGGSLVQK